MNTRVSNLHHLEAIDEQPILEKSDACEGIRRRGSVMEVINRGKASLHTSPWGMQVVLHHRPCQHLPLVL